jgi:hypothetical protein
MRWLLLIGLAGCGHTEVHEVVLRAPSAPTASPEIYMEDQQPARPYYEVAMVQALGYGSDANLGELTNALAKRGAQLGCDALVRVRVDLGISRGHGFGVCVRWSPTAPR